MFNLKALSIALGLTLSTVALNTAKAQANLNELANYAHISVESIQDALSKATYQQKIIDAITRPGEAKPWWQYRKIFITTSRVKAAVDFYWESEQTF